MLPNIFRLLDPAKTEAIKQHSLNAVNLLLLTRAPAIEESMESYMKHIISMQNDPSNLIKWRIVQGVVTITDMEVDLVLKPENFNLVSDFLMSALRNKDPKIAQSACEFWSAIICASPEEEEIKVKTLREKLPQLLPILMECCLLND